MALKVFKILVLAEFLFFYFSRTEFCRESRGLFVNNQVLIGFTYKSVITRGILACAHKCLADDPLCTSYNYQTSAVLNGVCELHDANLGSKELFVEKRGFAFIRMRNKMVSTFEFDYSGCIYPDTYYLDQEIYAD